MPLPYWPAHYDEILSTIDWLESLAAREVSVLEPLARWLKDGNHSYNDIPPGIRNEIFFKDLTTGESHAGGQWKEWGWNEADMSGILWQEKAHPDDRDFLYRNLPTSSILDGVRITQSVFRTIDNRGNYHWNLASSAAVHWTDDGTIYRYVGRDLDIGSQIERELHLRRDLLEVKDRAARDAALLEAAGQIAAVSDHEGLATAIENAVPEILGMDTFRLIAVTSETCRVLLGPDIPAGSRITDSLINLTGDGNNRCGKCSSKCASIEDHQAFFSVWDLGKITQGRAFAVLRSDFSCDDGTDRLMSALGPIILRAWDQLAGLEELRRHANTDQLTGAWTRRPFLDQAGRRLRRNYDDSSETTVVMFDIDHFKKVNDTFGHPRGDTVLSSVAREISRTLRARDLMCRWGGEEFVVFIEGVGAKDAYTTVERIREAASLAGTGAIGAGGSRLTLSAGICVLPLDFPISLETAIEMADKALLRAKNLGEIEAKSASLRQSQSEGVIRPLRFNP